MSATSPPLVSALYEGRVRHRRFEPVRHEFEYRVFLAYLDLDELPEAFDRLPLWSARRSAPVRFRRADYLGDESVPLRVAVLDEVERALGRRPAGAVRMLTHLRTLGFVFNPVTFYYCHATDGALDAVVAEITNTPWKERHRYVLDAAGTEGAGVRARFAKAFHVSPFMGMDCEYDWTFSEPGEDLRVEMRNLRGGRCIFDASASLHRKALTRLSSTAVLLRHPALTLRVVLAIYWQALRLKWKGATFHPHPRLAGDAAGAAETTRG